MGSAPSRLRVNEFGFTAGAGNPVTDASFIGHGVHADVHIARFVPVPGATELWVGTDGGIFRSQQGDADNRAIKNTFVSRNTGIASLQCGYIVTTPSVVTGRQPCATSPCHAIHAVSASSGFSV